MKKFLGKVSPIDSLSELEQRSSMDIDPSKIKSLLNVEEYPEALAKLYRIISTNTPLPFSPLHKAPWSSCS